MRVPLRGGGVAALLACVAAISVDCGSSEAAPDRVLLGDGGGFPDGSSGEDEAGDGDGAAAVDAATDAPAYDGGEPATITKGAPDRLLLLGTIVSPDTSFDGQVLVEQDKITCVGPGDACASAAGAAGATVIDTKGVIAPGLVDAHNHILFDVFDGDDWLPSKLYTNHTQWTAEPRYAAMLDVKQCLVNDSQGKPSWCLAGTALGDKYGNAAGSLRCEFDKWGELKGLVAGTTSIVGLAGTTSGCFASLSRSIDAPQNGFGTDTVRTSATFPPSTSTSDSVCAAFASGAAKAFLVHCGEGLPTDATALGEFDKLKSAPTTDGCLDVEQTAITHGAAFGAAQFQEMAQAKMKLTWSPQSNVSLYGATADIPTARAAGVVVSLGPDWSMGGSQNMLDELRFADAWDRQTWGRSLTAKDLVTMATKNGAAAVGYADKIGTLDVGYYADIVVVGGDRSAPYDAIVAARPEDVRLTVVGGKVLYGDAQLEGAGPAAPGCESMDVCGAPKFLCAATADAANKLGQTFAQIQSALDQAFTDVDTGSGSAYKFAPVTPLVKCR